MQMRDAAERVLFSNHLEDKLELAPKSLADDCPGSAIALPDSPVRPDALKITAKGVRAEFPGVNKLDDDVERGKMMHFLANHELLAAELMALVLLRFPDAPKEYRRGVYEAMREEQMHTRMYLRRMSECGIQFGDLPVNDYFWRLIAPMETPLDFVTRLNLTFEQANLDFSKHYAKLFREVGDTGTAAVLEKIYLDEIGHVGHGVKWFRKWKQQGESDWQAFKKYLTFPLAPAKAKGMAPYNAEGRRLAGFDDEFISELEVCEQSRGRTPVLHWYNPLAESYVADPDYQPSRVERAMETDLELLTLAWCRRDDMILLREHPGNAHLARLKNAGLHLPEVGTIENLLGSNQTSRKLGGMRPWAWSPDASDRLQPLAENVSVRVSHQWREPLPAAWLGKECVVGVQEAIGETEHLSVFCTCQATAEEEIKKQLQSGDVLLKANHSCAARGHRKVGKIDDSLRAWLAKTCAEHRGVIVEPWLNRVIDFSALYEVEPTESGQRQARFLSFTRMENDRQGRYLGTLIDRKWGQGMDDELREFVFQRSDFASIYKKLLPDVIERSFSGYIGPLAVDAMIYRQPDGTLALRRVVEVNTRMSMGRVAYELRRKLAPQQSGKFSILRRKNLTPVELEELCATSGTQRLAINNPLTAKEFIAVWEKLT